MVVSLLKILEAYYLKEGLCDKNRLKKFLLYFGSQNREKDCYRR